MHYFRRNENDNIIVGIFLCIFYKYESSSVTDKLTLNVRSNLIVNYNNKTVE